MEWISLLFPAFIAIKIRNRRREKKYSKFECVCSYAQWVLTINVLTSCVILYVFKQTGVLSEALNSFSFALKYILLSCGLAIILPYILELIEKYMDISVEIGKIDEQE